MSLSYLFGGLGRFEFVVGGQETVAVGRQAEATLRLDERQSGAVAGAGDVGQQLKQTGGAVSRPKTAIE